MDFIIFVVSLKNKTLHCVQIETTALVKVKKTDMVLSP